MKLMTTPVIVLSCVLLTSSLPAEEGQLKSGPQPGESLRPFLVEKCAGSEDDRVKKGQKLCYRCMLGNRPVVAVFARKPDAQLTNLLKELDSLVAKHENKKLASFVSLLGQDKEELKAAAEKLVKTSQVKNIAVVVPDEHAKGPENYKLNPKADFTVLVYKEGKVEVNFALTQQELNDKSIKEITKAATKLAKSAT